MALSGETLGTALKLANVGFFSCMRSEVSLKVAFLIKCFLTPFFGADKLLLSRMSLHMNFQTRPFVVGFATVCVGAYKLLSLQMRL